MSEYTLNIADYIILFNAMTGDTVLSPSARQRSFMTTATGYHLAVNVFRGPVKVNEQATAVFRAPYVEEVGGMRLKKNDEFWTVYRLGDYILVKTTCPVSPGHKEALLVIRPGEKSWDIIIDSSGPEIDPLVYPVDGLLLYYLTALQGDIFIHGSGMYHKEKGYLFTGPSGKGKTTMAQLFSEAGADVVHDDRLILRKKNDSIYMYNTPVYDNDRHRSCRLDSLFVIDHGEENVSSAFGQTDAITSVMSNCIQHHWDTRLIAKLTGAIIELVKSVNIRKLHFVPNSTVVSFIENNEY